MRSFNVIGLFFVMMTVACAPGGGRRGGSSSKSNAANALTMSMKFDNPGAKIVEGKPPEATPGAEVKLIQTSGGGSSVTPEEYRVQGAADAVLQKLEWVREGVERLTSSPPTPTAGAAVSIRPSEPVHVEMQPGGEGGIGVQVDNSNPDGDPIRHIVLWIEGGQGHITIPVEQTSQTGDGDVFQAQFMVGSDVCANVCNQDIEVRCHKAARTEQGDVTQSNVAVITLRCSETGDSGKCTPPDGGEATGGPSTMTVGPGSSGVVAMTVQNPDEENDPTVATLIWMEGADSYIELPADGAQTSGTLPKTLANGFVITQDICDDLCNIAHQVKCYEAAKTASGIVTAATLTDISVLCEEAGSPQECSSSGGSPTPNPNPNPNPNPSDPCASVMCDADHICLQGDCVPKTAGTSCQVFGKCCSAQDDTCKPDTAQCFCDEACAEFGDCCSDACSVCGWCGSGN